MKRILNTASSSSNADDSGPPLTTKAFRDLEKAQNERIYDRILVRIRFPDRTCIQGYFHPSHKMLDVYDWINSCLDNTFAVIGSDTVDKGTRFSFELYTSPPKQMYASTNEKTLNELRLVPAVMFILSWSFPIDSKNTLSEKRLNYGSYFRAELLVQSSNSDVRAYPEGKSLIEPSSGQIQDKDTSDATYDKKEITSSAQSKKSKAKPSWLKV